MIVPSGSARSFLFGYVLLLLEGVKERFSSNGFEQLVRGKHKDRDMGQITCST